MEKASKLTSKQESEICLACGECCKKYWITVLPQEAVKIAKTLGKSKKAFLEEDCIIFVKLFPKSTPGVLTFPSTFFPERIYSLIEKELGTMPESFFIVPQIVLKREEKTVFNYEEKTTKIEKKKACAFLDEKNACKIYSSRPSPCKLFPFIAVPGYEEQYPFCQLFRKTFKDYSLESKIYYGKVQDYFKEVDEKGFSKFWRTTPSKGLLFIQDKQLSAISIDELETMMQAKKN